MSDLDESKTMPPSPLLPRDVEDGTSPCEADRGREDSRVIPPPPPEEEEDDLLLKKLLTPPPRAATCGGKMVNGLIIIHVTQ